MEMERKYREDKADDDTQKLPKSTEDVETFTKRVGRQKMSHMLRNTKNLNDMKGETGQDEFDIDSAITHA